MNNDNVIDSMGRIDDDLIQSVEALRRKKKRPAWVKWGAMAACLCLIVAGAVAVPRSADPGPGYVPSPDPNGIIQREEPPAVYPSQPILRPGDEGYIAPAPTLNPQTPWTLCFNEAISVLSAGRAYVKGYFTEELNAAELAALLPDRALSCSGYAGFDQDGNLLDIVMQVETSLSGSPVNIGLADYYFGFDYVLAGDEAVSVCNGVDYRACQYRLGDKVELAAHAIINDVYFVFTMTVPQSDLEQAQKDFQSVLECFAHYGPGKPDLSAIAPETVPQLREQMFSTLAEARTEPDFGRYLPDELPEGFSEAAIYRLRFHTSDFLSALWAKGMDTLSWVIEPYTEADAPRLTGVADKKNYDLSLYPIPRADSVPEELREMVDNPIFAAEELTLEAVRCRAYKVEDAGDTDGWRMRFSVKYGDVVVSVSAKGVEPEWLYRQLAELPCE